MTIDKCQGCRHWHIGIADKECSMCNQMPLRENGRPYNYDEVRYTTFASKIDPTAPPIDFHTTSKPVRNFDRFDTKDEAYEAWKKQEKRYNEYVAAGFDKDIFETWLFERAK